MTIFDAKMKLNEFLKDNPKAQEMQKLIDAELNKAGNNSHNRLAIMEKLFYDQIEEFKKIRL